MAPQLKYYGLIDSNGRPNFKVVGLKKEVFSDLFHFFITKSWFQFISILFLIYITANLIFGCFYFLLGGIDHAEKFLDYFFFSIQTMGTIGYGYMYPNTDNIITNFVVSVETYVGILFTAFVTGLFYSKFSLPTSNVMYTKKMVVNLDNDVLKLKFKISNKRNSNIINADLKVSMLKLVINPDGTRLKKIFDMKLLRHEIPTFVLTFTAEHVIDEFSPFYGETHQSLLEKEALVSIIITGVDEVTSQTIHSKYYYAFDDIMWNAKFADVIFKDEFGQSYLDYRNFDKIIQ
ncbi:MAG: ion channel [Cyanobacteriota bacterium]